METKELKLSTLNGGAAEDLFNEELDRVLRNINDINTEATAIREITLKIKIVPSENRGAATTAIQATSRLAPNKPVAGTAVLGFSGNQPKAYAYDPRQMTFDAIK